MRILIISNLCPPYAIGGYEIAAIEIANMLKKNGHEVAIFTSNYDKRFLTGTHVNNEITIFRKLLLLDSWHRDYKIQSIQSNRKSNTSLTRKVIEEFRPDLVYAWNQANLGSEPLICVEKMNIPIVHHLMSSEILMYAKFNQSWEYVTKRFLRDLLATGRIVSYLGSKHFKNIIYISDFTKRDVEKNHIAPKNSCVIYPSVEVDRIFPKTCYKLIKDKIKIVYLGQVARHKGIECLVKSLQEILQKTDLNIDLTIFGGGDIKLIEELMISKNNRLSILVTGMIDKLEIYKNLKNYDLGVFPSEWDEPFGIAQMEMMCAGLPIISSARGGSAEILENGVNSLFYQAGNINGLAAQIIYLVEHYNDIAEALGQNARRNVIGNFNSAKINQKIISFITSVANGD